MTERPIICSGPMVRAILDGRKTQTRRVVQVRHGPFAGMPVTNMSGPHTGFKGENHAPTWVADHQGEVGIVCSQDVPQPCHPGDRLWVRETWRFAGQSWRSGDDFKVVNIEYAEDKTVRKIRRGRDDDSGIPKQNMPDHIAAGNPHYGDVDYDKLAAYNDWLDRWWVRNRPSIHMARWASRITLEVTNVRVERLQDISEDDAITEGVKPSICGQDEHGHLYRHRTGFVRLWNDLNAKRGHGWDTNPWVWVIEFRPQ